MEHKDATRTICDLPTRSKLFYIETEFKEIRLTKYNLTRLYLYRRTVILL